MSPSAVLSPERWRKPASVFFGAVWLAAALFTVPPGFGQGWHEAMEWSGFFLLIAAALGRIWAYAHIGGRKNRELCTTGPYSLTRNPLYLFSFLGVVGAGLALQSPLLALAGTVVFLGYYGFVIRAEEKRLRTLFGPAFESYTRRIPRFWPRLARPDHGGDLVVPARLFARTLGEIFWFLAAIILIELIEEGKLHHLWAVLTTRL